MKRLKTIFGVILFASFFQTSCGDNRRWDAEVNRITDSIIAAGSTSTEKVEDSLNEINVNNPNSIIGNTIKIGNLEIAQYSFTNQMTWHVAMKACNDLGNGWRLPTKNELDIIYVNNTHYPSFYNLKPSTSRYYLFWSSSEGNDNNAWAEDFGDVNDFSQFCGKNGENYARAVRGSGGNCSPPISISSNPIIGNTIKIEGLEIAQKNFPYKMNWEDAKNACVGLRDRWRLPNRYEFDLLNHYQSNTQIGFVFGGYWTSEESNGGAWYGSIGSGGTYFSGSKDELLDVRAVRDYIVSSQNIIGNTIKIGNLEIAQIDFPFPLTFLGFLCENNNGKKKSEHKHKIKEDPCADLGDGWRLPTIEELDILYTNKDLIGGFATDRRRPICYLSSTLKGSCNGHSAIQVLSKDFSSGKCGERYTGGCRYFVRAVRGSGGNLLDTISDNSSNEL